MTFADGNWNKLGNDIMDVIRLKNTMRIILGFICVGCVYLGLGFIS